MFGLSIAKMKTALGSEMSELITGVFKGEKQCSPIMPLPVLAKFSSFYYANNAYDILQEGNNLNWL